MADITSRPYQPDSGKCCEACVFGRGEHAAWCALRTRDDLFRQQLAAGVYPVVTGTALHQVLPHTVGRTPEWRENLGNL